MIPAALDDAVPGEMARRVRETDWSKTPLGAPESWPQSLKLSLTMILACGFPMAIRWGPELIFLYNDAYRPILGDKHPHALGKALREVWPEIYGELGPLNQAILTGERPGYFADDQHWTVRRHGAWTEDAHFTISYSPIPDDTAPHGIGGILTTAVETTQRVRAEETLRSLNSTLEEQVAARTRERDRIWQVSEDLLGVANFDGYFTSINPAWSSLLGWRDDEIKAMRVNELLHPDDVQNSDAGRAQLAAGVPTVRLENRLRHKDGSWRWLHWTMTAEQGLIYVIGRHVTAERQVAQELRDSDRQFRLLVAGVTDYALFMLDTRGVISSWNAGAQRIKGYLPEEIVGRHFSNFYTAEDRAAGVPARALATAARQGTYEAEGWRVRKNGSLFFASVVIDAIHDEQGTLIGFAKITRDITERREAQLALQRAQEQLVQSQKMEALGQLTGGVAHDFNNMLMVVSGNAQTLKRRLGDPRDLRAVEAIELAAARGENLTRQLLTFARRQALNPVAIRLREHLAAFRDVLDSSVRGNIDLVVDISEDVWPVAVDIPEFELALINTVVNARDAMPEGGTLTIGAQNVRLRAADTPERVHGKYVALSVTDTGCGIAADVLPKVFEPFFTTKELNKGTGLGLSQVYGFTRQSGGTVAIASDPGRGTTVTLYLPRSLVPVAAQPETMASAGSGLASETILLVEDNPEVKEIAASLLDQLGYQVNAVDSATEAMQVLDSGERVDLVFSDVVMPGDFDGLALANRVSKEYPQIPVLLTSGYAKAASAAEKGFTILRKPYRLAALAEAVRDALDRGHPDRIVAG
ncbi:MAG: PAS domain S-box protein [Alphaproteobacteria bacterium]|nr:PAS domain S-box protein [Alphaproteobacteria bacterium]